jgi:hypothetical protein
MRSIYLVVAAKNYGRKMLPFHSIMLYWLWGKTPGGREKFEVAGCQVEVLFSYGLFFPSTSFLMKPANRLLRVFSCFA